MNDEICEAHAATTPLFDTVSGLLRTGDACTVDVAALSLARAHDLSLAGEQTMTAHYEDAMGQINAPPL